jgi:hypothetical protein
LLRRLLASRRRKPRPCGGGLMLDGTALKLRRFGLCLCSGVEGGKGWGHGHQRLQRTGWGTAPSHGALDSVGYRRGAVTVPLGPGRRCSAVHHPSVAVYRVDRLLPDRSAVTDRLVVPDGWHGRKSPSRCNVWRFRQLHRHLRAVLHRYCSQPVAPAITRLGPSMAVRERASTGPLLLR